MIRRVSRLEKERCILIQNEGLVFVEGQTTIKEFLTDVSVKMVAAEPAVKKVAWTPNAEGRHVLTPSDEEWSADERAEYDRLQREMHDLWKQVKPEFIEFVNPLSSSWFEIICHTGGVVSNLFDKIRSHEDNPFKRFGSEFLKVKMKKLAQWRAGDEENAGGAWQGADWWEANWGVRKPQKKGKGKGKKGKKGKGKKGKGK